MTGQKASSICFEVKLKFGWGFLGTSSFDVFESILYTKGERYVSRGTFLFKMFKTF